MLGISQFAHELTCLYCGKPNPATQWRVMGDLVPYYCQREPGRYNLTMTCPHCDRVWYVVWDDNPGEIERLLLPGTIERTADVSADEIPDVEVSPFVLDGDEEDEGQLGDWQWLREQSADAAFFLTHQTDPSSWEECSRATQRLIQQFPTASIVYSWAAYVLIRMNRIDEAAKIVEEGLLKCQSKVALYGIMAQIAEQRKDLLGILGWSIKTFVACHQKGVKPENQVTLYIAEVSNLLGRGQVANRLKRSLDTGFDNETLLNLQSICSGTAPARKARAIEYLDEFNTRFLQATGSGPVLSSGELPNDGETERIHDDTPADTTAALPDHSGSASQSKADQTEFQRRLAEKMLRSVWVGVDSDTEAQLRGQLQAMLSGQAASPQEQAEEGEWTSCVGCLVIFVLFSGLIFCGVWFGDFLEPVATSDPPAPTVVAEPDVERVERDANSVTSEVCDSSLEEEDRLKALEELRQLGAPDDEHREKLHTLLSDQPTSYELRTRLATLLVEWNLSGTADALRELLQRRAAGYEFEDPALLHFLTCFEQIRPDESLLSDFIGAVRLHEADQALRLALIEKVKMEAVWTPSGWNDPRFVVLLRSTARDQADDLFVRQKAAEALLTIDRRNTVRYFNSVFDGSEQHADFEKTIQDVLLERFSRNWADATGRFQVEAVLLDEKDGKVQLLKTDRKTVEVPTRILSQDDQDYVAAFEWYQSSPQREK